jgi:hypothetical protein
MRWTDEKVAELRGMASQGSREIAGHFGISIRAVQAEASKCRIHLGRGSDDRDYPVERPEVVRARWALLIPGMKSAIRESAREEWR